MSAEKVKAFVLARLQARHAVTSLADDLDLLESGYLDSLGIVELIGDVERQFGVVIDFTELEADELTIIGPFCRYVAGRLSKAQHGPVLPSTQPVGSSLR